MRQENIKNAENPTVWNRLQRFELDCSICPPNRGENKKCRHKKYGVRKPRIKQRDRRTWVPIEEW